jgi:hypothetical protein
MKTLFYNAVHCSLCGDNIQSYYGHDYKHCSCGNAMVDGGLNYARWGWREENSVIDFSMFIEDHPFSIIRQYFYRWNNIIQEYVLLKDIPDDWLEAILLYYIPSDKQLATMRDEYLILFLMEKQYRMYGEE